MLTRQYSFKLLALMWIHFNQAPPPPKSNVWYDVGIGLFEWTRMSKYITRKINDSSLSFNRCMILMQAYWWEFVTRNDCPHYLIFSLTYLINLCLIIWKSRSNLFEIHPSSQMSHFTDKNIGTCNDLLFFAFIVSWNLILLP